MAILELSSEVKSSSRPRTQGFVTKKAHRKSRAGCWGCKQKKIKCDESRPQCTYCKTHRFQCIYGSGDAVTRPKSTTSDNSSVITWSSTSSPRVLEVASRLTNRLEPSLSLFPNWNLDDSRLLHHYLTRTAGSFHIINRSGADQVMSFDIPRIAAEHDFMMHSILGIASLHLHYLAPDVPEHISLSVAHRVNALSGLRVALSQITRDSYRAVVAASLFIQILSSDPSSAPPDGDLWIGDWLGLWTGIRDMIRVVSWDFVVQSGLSPIFARDTRPRGTLANLPATLTGMLALMSPGEEDTTTIRNTLRCLSRLYECLLLHGFSKELTTRVIAWPAALDVADFAALVKLRRPQALIIASHYLAFAKLVEEIWWMADISGREIEAIASVLPLEYQSLMATPLQAIHLASKWDIANLLLSQLPGGLLYDDDFTTILNSSSKLDCARAVELLPMEEIR